MDGKEFLNALENIVKEKKISKEVIFEAMELALATAYKKNFNSLTNVRVDINRETGKISVYSFKTVVKKILTEEDYADMDLEYDENGEEIEFEIPKPETLILLKDAKKIVPGIKEGETIENEVTPKDFGRVAAGTAKQVIMQKVREAEKEAIRSEFEDKQDELVNGIVEMEDEENYFVDLGRTKGILAKKDIIPGEIIKIGQNIKVYVTKVDIETKGVLILLSRKHFGFVKRLFELEIPELSDGTVILYSVARDAGLKSKVSVYSTNPSVDAVGCCIGEYGARINRILSELGKEKVDIVLYDKDPEVFIVNALATSRDFKGLSVMHIDLKTREALVVADKEALSLAIGKKGQNIKLASILTKFKISIQSKEDYLKLGDSYGK